MLWRLGLGVILLAGGSVMLIPLGFIWFPRPFGYYAVGLEGDVSALRELSLCSALGGAAGGTGVMLLARAVGLRRREAVPSIGR